jgi:hypothetical protein
MLFVLLAGISILLAVVQVRSRGSRDPAGIRAALVRGGSAFLAGWLLQAAVSRLAGPRPSSLHALYAGQSIVLALLSLLLWSALARLAFYRFERRDLLWIVPFGTLSILVGAAGRVIPLTAALLAWPAILPVRWLREVGTGSQSLVAIFGFLLILLNLFSIRLRPPADPFVTSLFPLERYADWVRALTGLHLLVALPRLLWGMDLPIRSVKRRLMVSHILAGVVPISLIAAFWGLGTYLSVNGERARIAAHLVREEARQLAAALDQSLNDGAGATPAARLTAWAGIESAVTPGVRVWLDRSLIGDGAGAGARPEAAAEGGGTNALLRIFGDPVPGEEALVFWPDSIASGGIILLDRGSYLGAIRRRAGSAAPEAAILIPTSSILGENVRRQLDAEVFLETRWVVQSAAGGLSIATAGRDTTSARPRTRPVGAATSPGAAVLSAMEWSGGHWRNRAILLWARVGFVTALRGLARNLQENPFNLIPLVFLSVVGLLFVFVEVVTLGMVTSMGRSILRALNALRQGTARLRSGNLRYRIPIEGNDDLWDVADSFNEMAGDLDKARELEIENERIEGELSLARRIQARLLPGEVPAVAHLELAGLYVPARQVGGDYYDFLPMGPDRVGLIVADVSGKGIPAALLMSSFRASLLSQDLEGKGPGLILATLNSFLHRSVEPGRFVTAFLAVLTPSTGQLVYSNAGHNPPFLLREDGSAHLMKEGGLVLGLFGQGNYEQVEVQLSPGDLLALYTDGVTEAQSEDEEFWGEDRLLDLLRGSRVDPCRKIIRDILSEVRTFTGDHGQGDDITMVLARWKGSDFD